MKVILRFASVFCLVSIFGLLSCDDKPSATPAPVVVVVPDPVITKIEPLNGTTGDIITLTGKGLTAPNTKVYFSNRWFQLKPDIEAEIVENVSDVIKVKIPDEPLMKTVEIYVKRNDLTSNSISFQFNSRHWKELPLSIAISKSFSIGAIGYFIDNSKVSSFSTETNQLTKLNDFSEAQNKSLGTAFSFNGKGYVMLNVSSSMSELWEYDPTADSWSFKSKSPLANLYEGISFVIDSKAYIGGGQNNMVLYAYNFGDDTWTKIADYPGASANGVSTTVVNGIAYCFAGGYYYNKHNGNWKYEPSLNKWTKLTNNPDDQVCDDRSYGAILSSPDKIYWGAGFSTFDGIEMSYMYEYSIAGNSWKLHSIIPNDFPEYTNGSPCFGFESNGKAYFAYYGVPRFFIFNPK